jgi:glycosyltransferase involved in cell wall biosynthesis
MAPTVTVIVPAHNPDHGRLRETLLGLRAQTLPADRWEALLVDNASTRWPAAPFFAACAPANFAVLQEPTLGLTAARRAGLSAARGEFAILVDDDNVLAPDYLERVLACFARLPSLGAAGGKSLPRFETEPVDWQREFLPLLALRDLGPDEIVSRGLRPAGATHNEYPAYAPIGAGMALRRAAGEPWLASDATLSDRRGGELTSSGDNDIVLTLLHHGWEVGYFPELSLTHLIPAGRLTPGYLARLNRGIQKSWMQVLTRHDANPWPPISASSALLRKTKAWFTYRGWSGSAGHIRWQGACGHFDGRIGP